MREMRKPNDEPPLHREALDVLAALRALDGVWLRPIAVAYAESRDAAADPLRHGNDAGMAALWASLAALVAGVDAERAAAERAALDAMTPVAVLELDDAGEGDAAPS